MTEFRERVARAATALSAAGLAEGGLAAFLLRNDIAYLEASLAVRHLGAYGVPLNSHFTAPEVAHILGDSGATHLVVHADLLGAVAPSLPDGVQTIVVSTPPEVREAYGLRDDQCSEPAGHAVWDAWIEAHEPIATPARPTRGTMSYTSGTTGRPKGVRRETVRDADRDALAQLHKDWFGIRRGMRTAMIGPMYHSVQTSYALAAIAAHGSVVIHPRFDAEAVLQTIEHDRLTHLHLVPIMMNRLLRLPEETRRQYDLSSLEFVVHGAAPCPPDVKRRMIDWWGPIIHEYYGTTEVGMVSRASSDEWLAREGTVGRAWPGRTIRIYDDDGRPLPPRAVGEVYMSFGLVPDFTYHNAEDQRLAIERDGMVTNGDAGYLDEDGYLYLCDRKRDVVISGGVNVYPAEIEAALCTHPDVEDCAVFGVPDDEYGEQVAAAVQPAAGAAPSAEMLQRYLEGRLARFKIPRRIEISERLPRDASGKIFKHVLRDRYRA